MALETDIKNPDSHLHVSFYSREVINEFKSEAETKLQGVPVTINDRLDYIRIQIPGNKLLDMDTPARESHKKRFPMHWAAYQNRGDEYGNVSGMPIEQWPRVMVNPDMAMELRGLKFSTVQAIAGASDSQLQSIGMVAGQNAFTFRDEARKFLAERDASSKLADADKKHSEADARLAEANAKLLAQQEQHAKDMEEMRSQMKQLMDMAAQNVSIRKPGRPPKEVD